MAPGQGPSYFSITRLEKLFRSLAVSLAFLVPFVNENEPTMRLAASLENQIPPTRRLAHWSRPVLAFNVAGRGSAIASAKGRVIRLAACGAMALGNVACATVPAKPVADCCRRTKRCT